MNNYDDTRNNCWLENCPLVCKRVSPWTNCQQTKSYAQYRKAITIITVFNEHRHFTQALPGVLPVHPRLKYQDWLAGQGGVLYSRADCGRLFAGALGDVVTHIGAVPI
eukprot:3536776-Pyramimonas_sp.AAC.6